jgi:hypothetical protein
VASRQQLALVVRPGRRQENRLLLALEAGPQLLTSPNVVVGTHQVLCRQWETGFLARSSCRPAEEGEAGASHCWRDWLSPGAERREEMREGMRWKGGRGRGIKI